MIISGIVTVLVPWGASSHYGLLWFFQLIVGLAYGVILAIVTGIMHIGQHQMRERNTC